MKFLFVRESSKISVVQCEDYLGLEVAQSMWKGQGREGEVVAITKRGLLGLRLTSEMNDGDMRTILREVFDLGRRYERQRQEKVEWQTIVDAEKRIEGLCGL